MAFDPSPVGNGKQKIAARRRWFRRRIPSALLCLLAAPAIAQAGSRSSALLASQPKLLHLATGDAFPFTLDTVSAKYVEVLLETSLPGVAFVVEDPDGRPMQTATADYPGWLALSFPVASSGQYRIVVKAIPVREAATTASVRVSILPLPSAGAVSRRKAEDLFARAQPLVHSATADDIRRAIVDDTQAAAAWAQAGEREGQVLALASEARAWLALSEYSKATTALTRALGLCAPALFWHTWLLNLQAQVDLEQWDHERARRNSEDAVRLSRTLHDDWLLADSLADRGGVAYFTHSPSAKDDIEESMRLARAHDAVGTLARALRYHAWMEKDQGYLTRAFAQLDQARGFYHQDGDAQSEMQAMATLAIIAGTAGDPYASLLRHTSLVPMTRESGSTAAYALLLGDLGADYRVLNRTPEAILYYQQALAAFRSIHHTSGEAFTLSSLCTVETKASQRDEATRDCRAAATIVEQLHDPMRTGTTTLRLGQMQQSFGQTASAIASFRRAAQLSESVHDNRFMAEALLDWADAVAATGTTGQAQPLFQRALRLAEAAENISLQLEIRYRIAQTEFRSGHDEEAKRNLDVALNRIAVQRRAVGNAALQAAYFAQVRKCHDLYVDILMNEQQHDPSSGAAAKALEISESGRALTLLDTLAARDAGVSQAATASQGMRELHLAVEQAYDQRLKLMVEGAHKTDLDANTAKLTQVVDALERAEDGQKAAHKPTVPGGQPLSAARISAATEKDHTTFVEYMLGDTHSYVWIVDHGRIESHILPPRAQIASLVRQWRELATAHTLRSNKPDPDLQSVAAKLSCTLLGDYLQPAMEHLVIVPDGELHLLPFAALPENGCASPGEAIVATHRVVLTPSLSILLSRPPTSTAYPGLVALLADPVFDRDDPRVQKTKPTSTATNRPQFAPALPRLFETGTEARAIVDGIKPGSTILYLGFDANLQTLLSPSLRGYRILHLATHGILDESVPEFSGIVLSLVDREGQPIFGYLKAHDIEALDLRSDLVVLSSCDSAAGVNLSGEGIRGLNHAFLSAGARRVVSTLWSVDDKVSQKLMTTFYRAMLQDGLDPAEALRKSQVEIMRNPGTAAPYYWAAFNLTSTVD